MHRPRTVDDLFEDPLFLESKEYEGFKLLADQGFYPSAKEAFLSIMRSVETIRQEDRDSWPDEINAAIEADKQGKRFPPLTRVASCLAEGDVQSIPLEHLRLLGDFVGCKHRGKRGKPYNEFDRECEEGIAERYEAFVAEGMTSSEAQAELDTRERLHIRTIQRTLKRVRDRQKIKAMAEDLKNQDMTRFFESDT